MIGKITVVLLIILGVMAVAVMLMGAAMYIMHRHHQRQLRDQDEARDFLEKVAYLDDVTGLFTTGKFTLEATTLLANAQSDQYSLLVFTVDNFDYITAVFGYKDGNRLLRCLGKFLTSRSVPEALCGSMQENKFVLLCKTEYLTSFMDALDVRWIAADFPDVNDLLGDDYNLCFSIGVYQIGDPAKDFSLMMEYADIAHQRSKKVFGTMVTCYSEELDLEMQLHGKMSLLMERGLSSEEFVPYLQPRFSLSSGKLVSAEVLARWESPSMGIVFPTEFIPLFEQNGFILKLDFYMLERSCIMLRQWIDNNLTTIPQLSVNFSKLTVTSEGFVERLVALAEKYDLLHSLLEVDITTSAVPYDATVISSRVTQLRDLGFSVLMNNPEDSQIATGIETQEQMESLRDSGRDIAQGFYFSRPVPWQEFEYSILSNINN